jgi:acyl phosphate:glycerol-3-phosphate acyltransferase
LIAVLVAYALGCVATGYLLVRWRTGQDVRRLGSGSTGATNVARSLGRAGFVATLLGDVAKGALAVVVARYAGAREPWVGAALVAVVAGHVWPAPLRFRGGKGIGTSIGALLVFDVRIAALLGALFLPGAAVVRRIVPAGLAAYALLPACLWRLEFGAPPVAATAALAAIVFAGHRDNIRAEVVRLRAPRAAGLTEPGGTRRGS